MKYTKLLLIALFWVFGCVGASAEVFNTDEMWPIIPGIYGPPTNGGTTNATDSIGTADLAGYGGIDLTQFGPGTPVLNSVTNNDTHASALSCFTIDNWNQLVPAGTYAGTATCHGSLPATGYLVSLTVGTQQVNLNLSVVSNTAYIRSHYEGPLGTLSNPDTSAGGQLASYLTSSTTPAGLNIILRPGSGTSGTTPGYNALSLANYSGAGAYLFFPPSCSNMTATTPTCATANNTAPTVYTANYAGDSVISGYVSGGVLCPVAVLAAASSGVTVSNVLSTGNVIIGVGLPFGGNTNTGPTVGGTSAACTNGRVINSDDTAVRTTLQTLNVASSGSPQNFWIGNFITVSGEFPNNSTDSNGNNIWGSSSDFGGMTIQTSGTSDYWIPWRFTNLNLVGNIQPTGGAVAFQGYSSGTTLCAIISSEGNGSGGAPIGALDPTFLITPEYVSNETTSSSFSTSTYIVADLGVGTSPCQPTVEHAYKLNNSQTHGSSGSPIWLFAGYPGSGGGQFNVINSSVLANEGGGTTTVIAPIYQKNSGFGLWIDHDYINIDKNSNFFGAIVINQGIINSNHFVGSPGAQITIGNGGYGAHNASGATVAACTGTQPVISCFTTYIWNNFSEGAGADFVDAGNRIADVDIEYNYEYNTDNQVIRLPINVGDVFQVTDNVTGVMRTYQVVPDITGASHQCGSPYQWMYGCGNLAGNVLYDSNIGQTYINLICTMNNGTATYNSQHNGNGLSASCTGKYPSNAQAPPSSWTSFYNAANATSDTIQIVPNNTASGAVGSVSGNIMTITTAPSSGTIQLNMVIAGSAYHVVTGSATNSATCGASACTGSGGTGTYLLTDNVFNTCHGSNATGTTTNITLASGTINFWDTLVVCSSSALQSLNNNTYTNWLGQSSLTGSGPFFIASALHPDFYQTISTGVTSAYPFVSKYNFQERGTTNPSANIVGMQWSTNNLGGSNLCCLTAQFYNNAVLNTQTNLIEIHGYNNTNAYFNSMITDWNSSAVDETFTSDWNAYKGLTKSSNGSTIANGIIETLCDNNASSAVADSATPYAAGGTPDVNVNINNNIASNVFNGSSSTEVCTTVGGTVYGIPPVVATTSSGSPLLTTISSSLLSTAQVTSMLQNTMPNYPSTGNGCADPNGKHNRSYFIKCLAPAKPVSYGQPIIGTFLGSLTTGCVLTTSTQLPLYTIINGPGLKNGLLNYGSVFYANAILTSSGSGPYTYTFNNISGCTAETNQTYSTGAENPDGTWNGAFFPPDNSNVISWNDGSVFDPTATHSPAR